jgi:hypothetical protein
MAARPFDDENWLSAKRVARELDQVLDTAGPRSVAAQNLPVGAACAGSARIRAFNAFAQGDLPGSMHAD